MNVFDQDRKPIRNLFSVRTTPESERPLYENGISQMPPLIERSPESRLMGRSRFWSIWTESIRLQRKLELLESAGQCCVEEYSSSGWF